MRDYISLGSAPFTERCVCVDQRSAYTQEMQNECKRYLHLLNRRFPDPPLGVFFMIKRCQHDFGAYYEVIIVYETESVEQVKYAYFVDKNVPATWEDTIVQGY